MLLDELWGTEEWVKLTFVEGDCQRRQKKKKSTKKHKDVKVTIRGIKSALSVVRPFFPPTRLDMRALLHLLKLCIDPTLFANSGHPYLQPAFYVIQIQLRGLQGHCRLAAGPDRCPTHSRHRVWLGPRRAGWHVKGPGGLQLQGHPQLSTEHRWV